MSRGKTKAERLREMEWLYLARAYSDTEIAQRLGVDRSTVYRDRLLLMPELALVEVEPGRWKVDRHSYISNVRLNLYEALALYLAARRVSRQTHTHQPHLASSLQKLAMTLRQPMIERLSHSADSVLSLPGQAERLHILETLAQAWVEQRQVRISYRSINRPRPMHHTVHPYLIEPSLWDAGTYIIGYSEVHEALTTFKLERIDQADLLPGTYAMPPDFDERELLRYAWGIWIDEDGPDTVRLHFSPGHAAIRLRESVWHPTQLICYEDDGGCIWEAQVADWREILPWVRGWGPDCEVLDPQEMRELIAGEAVRMAETYGGGGKIQATAISNG